VFKAVIFDVAGVLTESIGQILLEAAVGIEGDLEKLAEALIPVFMGEGDTDVAGHRLERGEITLDFFLASLGEVEKEAWTILHPDSGNFFGDNLESVTDTARLNPSVGTYGGRNLGGVQCPGIILSSFELTL